MALVKEYEEVFNKLAQVGYETMFEDRWDDLHPNSIERAMWLLIVRNVVERLRELCRVGIVELLSEGQVVEGEWQDRHGGWNDVV